MPAIDLPAVRQRCADIAALLPDVPRTLDAIRSLFDDYTDLTHRPSRVVAASGSRGTWRAPLPVLRAAFAALHQPVCESPPVGLALVKGLWALGSREERRLTAELAGALAPLAGAETLALIESWLPQIESADTAEALGEFAVGPLALAAPGGYLPRIRNWVTHPHKWVRSFGLAALRPLIRDKKWDDVPGALDVLRGVMTEGEPDVRRAVAASITELVDKSPEELARFLREQAVRPNNNSHWIIRNSMGRLSPDVQEEIMKVMRA